MPYPTLLFYMPFLSSFGGAAIIGFGFSRSGERVAAYFWNTNNTAWSNAGSWYTAVDHNTASNFPTVTQTAYVLTNTNVVLDNSVVNGVYTNWRNLDYWAPPTGITGVDTGNGKPDITITSNSFKDAPNPIAVFAPGSGSYALGTVVEYPSGSDTYYEAIAQANNTNLVNGVPNPAYWADQPSLPSNYAITNFNLVTIEGIIVP
jgi:hypothetical protein